jgi:hypothetical protein
LLTDFGGHRLQMLYTARTDRDIPALQRQPIGRGAAKTVAGSGDHGNLIFKPQFKHSVMTPPQKLNDLLYSVLKHKRKA